ncbi:3-oxoacyl-[acyl-carrier-protein] synthase III C-terminal domain-containing protein [Tenuibacillus multivorans]|uniref:3-oxoacyl-[acyl-carrier-protein] synthase-3 n=1 Tax=Tenuibacillus multivorans TaxID=237069 RepID=A0A1H0ATV7_9BACI|nr:3-oxoacyl-[acyl-carrier-protein] synthase III C-terminal domain-containing protein [Tenuibacillus multivorans]GEL77825.1 3-oxoacyl-ACP synthase [Tenuibacillus multivorans]SDN36789.1 3-oxoacyl-[acyl-carrier-protein] synthase-3 [Tenuibacillus multivorans]
MQNLNVVMKGIGNYHPENVVHNDYYIEHFQKRGEDVTSLLEHFGRENRYIIDNEEENSLTMAVESSTNALTKANIKADELDMIVFVTETPEYTVPSNALLLNQRLGAQNAHIVYDYNSNCIGLITAIDNIVRYMKSNNKVNKALVVASLFSSHMVSEENIFTYPSMADGSTAVVLEKIEENESRGFLDAHYYTDTTLWDKLLYPAVGNSNIEKDGISKADKRLSFLPHSVDFFADEWKKLIEGLLNEYELKNNDIDKYLFSQLNNAQVLNTAEKLNIPENKIPLVSKRFGYTGPSSPFLALHETLKNEQLSKGNYLVFCSVSAGISMAASLYKL